LPSSNKRDVKKDIFCFRTMLSGQHDSKTKYVSFGSEYVVSITGNEPVYCLLDPHQFKHPKSPTVGGMKADRFSIEAGFWRGILEEETSFSTPTASGLRKGGREEEKRGSIETSSRHRSRSAISQ
jgi:hypothetical protein